MFLLLWVIENSGTVYVALAAVAVVLLVAYWNTRQRRVLYAVAGTAALAGVVWLLTFLFAGISDDLQIKDSIQAMRQAVQKRDTAALFRQIAADFRLNGQDREVFRGFVERVLQSGGVTDVEVWNEEHAKVTRGPGRGQGRATIEFSVKPKGNLNDAWFGECLATFVLEPDGKWRLQTFEVREPGRTQPVAIPQLP
jgi:hypothetical protein